MSREDYIKYFTHMQEEVNQCLPSGMAWDDIVWHIHDAVDEKKLFIKNELADMFPDLLGHIRDSSELGQLLPTS